MAITSFEQLINDVNAQLRSFATEVGNDVTSGNLSNILEFDKSVGNYINSPLFPWTSSVIPLSKDKSAKGGLVSIWYKGDVLSKANFTGGTIVIFSGLNILNELCRIWIDYDKYNNAFGVNIQSGFTGDLPESPEAPAIMTITNIDDADLDVLPPETMVITAITDSLEPDGAPETMTIDSIENASSDIPNEMTITEII